MKPIGLLLFLSGLIGCKGGEPEPAIIGSWLLRESYYYGCFSSGRSTFKPEDQRITRFMPPNRYVETVKDTLVSSGTFTLASSKDNGTGKDALILTLTPDKFVRQTNDPYPFAQTVDELSGLQLSVGSSYGTGGSGAIYSRIR